MSAKSLAAIFLLASPDVRAEEIAWVWLTMPPGVAEELRGSAEAQAKADIVADKMKVKGFGLEVPDEGGHYERLLRKYRLTNDNLGCIVDERSEIVVRRYNEVIDQELERRYGARFWERFDAELQAARSAGSSAQRREASSMHQPNKVLNGDVAKATRR